MMALVDLSHDLSDGMLGFALRRHGEVRQVTASIRPFLTHEESAHFYAGKASFEITEMMFQTSVGTYLDAPRHRWKERRDIASLRLDEVVLPGLRIEIDAAKPGEPIGLSRMALPADLKGKAVLFRFGWDRYWTTPAYDDYPFIDRDVINAIRVRGARLVGIDALNVDTRQDPTRPAHSMLLGADILIVENLRGLDRLPLDGFRFFAVPIKAVGAAAMTVRAFAEIA
jgi:kynurenine formamidase